VTKNPKKQRRAERAPRRVPAKPASKEVVEAILAASAELLAQVGLDGLTTNHVAERAGVSVGSVYRYFPDKEAIVSALNLRRRAGAADRLMRALAAVPEGGAEAFASAVGDALTDFLERDENDRAIRLVMARDVPLKWIEKGSTEIFAALVPVAAAALRRVRPLLDEAEARRRVVVALHATEGVTLGSVLWSNELPRANAADELTRMLVPYLLK